MEENQGLGPVDGEIRPPYVLTPCPFTYYVDCPSYPETPKLSRSDTARDAEEYLFDAEVEILRSANRQQRRLLHARQGTLELSSWRAKWLKYQI